MSEVLLMEHGIDVLSLARMAHGVVQCYNIVAISNPASCAAALCSRIHNCEDAKRLGLALMHDGLQCCSNCP